MFKNTKLSSELQLKKESLESIGYSFDSISKKSGWSWGTPSDSSDGHLATEGDAIQDAWRHAGEQTRRILNIPADIWERMPAREQKEMIEDALPGQ